MLYCVGDQFKEISMSSATMHKKPSRLHYLKELIMTQASLPHDFRRQKAFLLVNLCHRKDLGASASVFGLSNEVQF